ncbi:MFS transporter [Nocardia wallacei]|uniref:MFS transporter n=1 Tax=Nocardia wallacei TaxID=480035 RepID=UPI00245908E9|nr:MFS transporter [Nocardia wallacei]
MATVDSAAGDRTGTVGLGALLAVVCAAQFMVVLDVSVVNVALPSIRDGLGFAETGLQWVVNAYALTFAGLLLLGGRLADLVGRRRVFLAGLGVFTAASLAGGLATSAAVLVVARAGQGVGAAVLAPATLTILTTSVGEGPRRTRALAAWTAVGLAGGTAGNLLGGVLTEFLSWRSTLLINVPVGVLAALAALRFVPRDRLRDNGSRIDVAGAVLATGGLGALAFGVAQAATAGWAAPWTLGGIGAGLVLLAGFAVVEARVAVPLVPLRLLRIRSVGVGNVMMLLAGACLNPMWYFLTLGMQNVLGYTALQTGLAFLPHTLVAVVVATRVTPWLMARIDSRVVIAAGGVLAAAGFWWQSSLGPGAGYVAGILGPAIVFSVGSGLLNTPVTTAVTSGVDTAEAGAASGLMNTTKQIGGGLGLAVLVALAVPAGIGASAYGRAFEAMAAIMLAVAALAWLLPGHRCGRRGGR